MSDVIDRLRQANPVRDCPPPAIETVWARIDRRGGDGARGPLGRALLLGLLAALPVIAVVVGIAVSGFGGERPSSTATAGSGVLVHYRARVVFRPAASSGASFAYEVDAADVWVSGARRHRNQVGSYFSRTGRQEGSAFPLEIATDGRVTTHFQGSSGAGELDSGPAGDQGGLCPLFVACAAAVAVDPAAELERMVRGSAIGFVAHTRLNGRPVDKFIGTGQTRLTIFVDRRTAVPVEIIDAFGPGAGPTVTVSIDHYERVPLTSANESRLTMAAHPGAKLMCFGPGGGGPLWPAPPHGCGPG